MTATMTASVQVAHSFRERGPGDALAQHVTCSWVQELPLDSAPFTYRTVPNGSAELVCTLGSLPRVVGPQTRPTEQVILPGTTMVGIRFRPGAAPCLLGLPASELVDLDLDLDDLWPGSAVALGESLAACRRLCQATGILEAVEVVRRLMPGQPAGLNRLATSLFISERQVRRRCEAAVGLAPKSLQRVFRFQRFLALAGTYDRPSTQLARLAADAGYADQSHLTRESMRLGGRSPKALLVEAERDCHCAHDHAASHGPFSLFP
jgi:AraC-like DNA-binding protein